MSRRTRVDAGPPPPPATVPTPTEDRPTTASPSWGGRRAPAPLMGSPSIVDGVWFHGDCDGVLHAYDARNPAVDPPELWQVPLGSCIESTPAVWNGRLYVGTRGGFVFGIGDQ